MSVVLRVGSYRARYIEHDGEYVPGTHRRAEFGGESYWTAKPEGSVYIYHDGRTIGSMTRWHTTLWDPATPITRELVQIVRRSRRQWMGGAS